MNFTPSTTFPTTWRRIRNRQVELAAGVALAVATALGLASLVDSQSGGTTPSPISGAETAWRTAGGADIVYIAGSEAQKDSVLAEVAELARMQLQSGREPGSASAIVAPRGNPDAELMIAAMVGEATSGSLTSAHIVDLR